MHTVVLTLSVYNANQGAPSQRRRKGHRTGGGYSTNCRLFGAQRTCEAGLPLIHCSKAFGNSSKPYSLNFFRFDCLYSSKITTDIANIFLSSFFVSVVPAVTHAKPLQYFDVVLLDSYALLMLRDRGEIRPLYYPFGSIMTCDQDKVQTTVCCLDFPYFTVHDNDVDPRMALL